METYPHLGCIVQVIQLSLGIASSSCSAVLHVLDALVTVHVLQNRVCDLVHERVKGRTFTIKGGQSRFFQSQTIFQTTEK